MTWVKICGITNVEDALTAVKAGADAIGFVFYQKSSRKMDSETAQEIVGALPREVEKVGVFVNESPEHMESVAQRVGLTAIQLQVEGSFMRDQELQGMTPSENLNHYIALPVSYFLEGEGRFDSFALSLRKGEANEWVSAIFLDSGTPQQIGGTGCTFNWQRSIAVAEAVKQAGFNLVVAGGLNPANVTEAIRILKPWGVDVSSGVESKPGKKDPARVRAFVDAVRHSEEVA